MMGHIVDFKFPAGLGTVNDNQIHNRRVAAGEKQYLPWEFSLGDGAYRQCPHILAKYPANTNYLYDPHTGKRDVEIPLHPFQQIHNERLNHDRQRIEHIVGLINKKHKLFQCKWQGDRHGQRGVPAHAAADCEGEQKRHCSQWVLSLQRRDWPLASRRAEPRAPPALLVRIAVSSANRIINKPVVVVCCGVWAGVWPTALSIRLRPTQAPPLATHVW